MIAIIDPMRATAETVLDRKRNSFVVSAYENTRICSSLDDFVLTMKPEERPHAFIIGSPPAFRGSNQQGKDVELQIIKAFPTNTPAVCPFLLNRKRAGTDAQRYRCSLRSQSVPTLSRMP